MRTIAFGYSTLCNLKCGHCVAKGEIPETATMDLGRARQTLHEMAAANVKGISFTAGEPLIFFNEIKALVRLCRNLGIYTRIVTNSFWATRPERANAVVKELKQSGLNQLRLSCSRWHQQGVDPQNLVYAAQGCERNGVDYFVSFVTDFSEKDDLLEDFLRTNKLRFFPEPLILSGRAKAFDHGPIRTDFQANCCAMNPYITPELDMYACCDAGTTGSNFTQTRVFCPNRRPTQALMPCLNEVNTTRCSTSFEPWAFQALPCSPACGQGISSPTGNAIFADNF